MFNQNSLWTWITTKVFFHWIRIPLNLILPKHSISGKNYHITGTYGYDWLHVIANDGVLMKPYIVDHIESSSGNVVSYTKQEKYKNTND